MSQANLTDQQFVQITEIDRFTPSDRADNMSPDILINALNDSQTAIQEHDQESEIRSIHQPTVETLSGSSARYDSRNVQVPTPQKQSVAVDMESICGQSQAPNDASYRNYRYQSKKSMHNIIKFTDKMNFEHKFADFKIEDDFRLKEASDLDKVVRKKEIDEADRKQEELQQRVTLSRQLALKKKQAQADVPGNVLRGVYQEQLLQAGQVIPKYMFVKRPNMSK